MTTVKMIVYTVAIILMMVVLFFPALFVLVHGEVKHKMGLE